MTALAPTTDTNRNELRDLEAQVEALHRSHAVIEFDTDGNVLTANDHFLRRLGYRLDEIRGRHHAMFCDPGYARSQSYRQFWQVLANGQFQQGEFRRVTKTGEDVWIQATYDPVRDEQGRVHKIVKVATDITEMVRQRDDQRGQIAALDKTMAVIEFDLDGRVVTANANFLRTLGYTLDEVRGKHHATFCEEDYARSPDYRQFWVDLANGSAKSGEFRRRSKDGREVWIQATYNPIYDSEGRLRKVVKFASDVTAMVEQRRINVRFASMNEKSPICTVFCDRDFVVRYANRAARRTLADVQKDLRVAVDRIVGTSVDCLLREPLAFRERLRDGRTPSFRYELDVGSETFEVTASAVHDDQGEHLGSMLSLLVVTERKRTEQQIAHTVESLTKSAATLASTSTQMTSSANETSGQAQAVSTAADAVSQNAQSVASGISQLEVSIQEISKNSAEAARVATLAVKAADATDGTVSKLGSSSAEIGKVVKVITSIAQQTNLLALNATIEAARAGEAGKGFAVVANEVKELAKETARATEDIGRKIDAIQSDTKGAVEAIAEIRNVIGRIHDIQTTIAGAVEEQTATTNELGRNISETARGSVDIARAIESVAEAASETSAGAAATHASADELTSLAENLGKLLRNAN